MFLTPIEMETFHKGWYLLYTRPKQEGVIADQLASLAIGHYLPKVRVVRKWSDRVKIVHTPLFPSYLFIHLQRQQDYFASLDTKGALHYVRFGNELARVADSLVDDLKIVVGSGAPVEVSYTDFKTGDQLTIAEGPLTGLHCEVVRYRNQDLILVRIHLLQRNVLLELPVSHLTKL